MTKDINEVFDLCKEKGIILEDIVKYEKEMKDNEKYLNMHNYTIWKGKDGLYRTHIVINGERKLFRRKTKKELEDFIVKKYKEIDSDPVIESLFLEWIDNKYNDKYITKQSYDRYRTDFTRFFVDNECAKDIMSTQIKNIDEYQLEKFIRSTIAAQKLTYKAYCGLRILINGIWKEAKSRKVTEISITNFMGDLDLPKKAFRHNVIKSKDDQIFTEAEVIHLTAFLKESSILIDKGLLLAFETGIRVGELSALKPEDISGNILQICRTEVKIKNAEGRSKLIIQEYPKTEAGDRSITLAASSMDNIREIFTLSKDNLYLFSKDSKRIRSNNFRKRLEVVCNKLGIKYKSPHKIRRTYGTTLIDSNCPDSLVANQMGHRNISTTRDFYYFANKSDEKNQEEISKAIKY